MRGTRHCVIPVFELERTCSPGLTSRVNENRSLMSTTLSRFFSGSIPPVRTRPGMSTSGDSTFIFSELQGEEGEAPRAHVIELLCRETEARHVEETDIDARRANRARGARPVQHAQGRTLMNVIDRWQTR
jgi:hypothetical protein